MKYRPGHCYVFILVILLSFLFVVVKKKPSSAPVQKRPESPVPSTSSTPAKDDHDTTIGEFQIGYTCVWT